ncbi:hypothetical protein C8A05DRAFT_36900 [Staphylotrichum tortipilum]|uniref:RING-CH-type domain-containing protein n=1 Tax=Staphylotrichum tortipilum TaxID=2831512 RepID=A0AAN6RRI1_9PEZI|nr:hypothetical protein C8A05DRAFT_36900 [Staphylotrichum longicolle]
MASESFQPQWGWPSEAENTHSPDDAAPLPTDEQHPGAPGNTTDEQPPSPSPTPARPQRHYKPRTCRICLETVQPTTDIDDSLAGRVFSSRARVRYVSDDPELGRLISPCKCKGSQKYVHEGCLQAWRKTSPLSDRNYWRCPTCQFQYRLQRLRWGRWLSSKVLRGALTLVIMTVTIFLLGFIADPIIGFWVDPFGSIAGGLTGLEFEEPAVGDDGPDGWATHFVKGFLSLGLLGFLKTMFVMSPWNWFNIRVGGGGRRRRGTGRDRMEQINWALVVIGVLTFLGATWKFVNHLMAKALEQASDHVVDVQEDTPDDDDEADDPAPEAADSESRKDR